MADVTVVAAEVLPDSGTVTQTGTLGGTVTAGQTVYKDANGTYQAADANASATTATVAGIAMTGGVSGQPFIFTSADCTLDPGFTVTVGAVYVQSATPGGIAPVADLLSGLRTTIIGVGLTASKLQVKIYNSLTAVP